MIVYHHLSDCVAFRCVPGSPTPEGTQPDICTPRYGDGYRDGNEECDDGNVEPLDGCNAVGEIENGFICTGGSLTTTDTCAEINGDGRRVGREQCDDANIEDGDGCASSIPALEGGCIVEQYWACDGGGVDTTDVCDGEHGDGRRVGTEQCDDGNVISGDGCTASCLVEEGWRCTGGGLLTRDVCRPIPGDGIVTGTEQCDDGNVVRVWRCVCVCGAVCVAPSVTAFLVSVTVCHYLSLTLSHYVPLTQWLLHPVCHRLCHSLSPSVAHCAYFR